MSLVENALTCNLILIVMLAFAEYESGMIVERAQTGKSVARLNYDFHDGRPRKYTGQSKEYVINYLEYLLFVFFPKQNRSDEVYHFFKWDNHVIAIAINEFRI